MSRPAPTQNPSAASQVPASGKVAAFTACTLIWGSTYLVISIGNDTVPPFWAATIRLVLAAAILLPIVRLRGQRLPGGDAYRAAGLYGFLQFGVNFPLLYWGETVVPSGLAAVMFATVPLTTAFLARAFGFERLTRGKVIGAIVALAGIAVIFWEQFTAARGFLGAAVILVGVWAACLGTMILKKGPKQSPIGVNAVGAMIGAAACLLWSVLAHESHALPTSWAAWFPILYLTLAGSVGAFVLWAWLVHHATVTRISYIAVISPLIALALGVLVRHERATAANLLGSLLVLAGVVIGLDVVKLPGNPRTGS